MGGSSRVSSYDDARAATQSLRSSAEINQAFAFSAQSTRSGKGSVHPSLNPMRVTRECVDTAVMPKVTPIAFAMDVTRSRGQDAKTVYGQLLPFLGSLYMSGAVKDPQLLFLAFGDAKSDRAPLQVGQFESDDRMDKNLECLWLEEGGGGTGEESSELAAYFLANHTKVDALNKRGQKGFCFFTSDEAPYPVVSADEVTRIIGDSLPNDIPSKEVFAKLQKQFHTYLLYPSKSLEDRKDDIDAEIRQRLLKAGGRFENCSIRASLIWNTYDDLDLHVVTPNGEHISFRNKKSSCGGELDVDRNAGGRQTRTPVENIRWAKGTALPGKYTVFVQNFAYHDDSPDAVDFRVELDIDGEIKTFTGKTKKGITGPASDVTSFEFAYAPESSVLASSGDHDAYADEVILGKWRAMIPDGHIIRLSDAKWTTEAAIGIMAIQSGVKTLEGVLEDMNERAVAKEGIESVKAALQSFSGQAVVGQVDENIFA